jgi:hypothetical protein
VPIDRYSKVSSNPDALDRTPTTVNTSASKSTSPPLECVDRFNQRRRELGGVAGVASDPRYGAPLAAGNVPDLGGVCGSIRVWQPTGF